MKVRFIKVGKKDRMMVRTNICEEIVSVKGYAFRRGYVGVGLVKFWLHVLFWWKKPRKKD